MHTLYLFISTIGLSLSILIFFFNKGYKSANFYLACFFFFISLYVLTNFTILYSKSTFWVSIFITTIPSFFFLIGPLSYFYVRSIVRDNPKLSRTDYLHFALFLIAFLGTMPILFSSWAYKQEVANILISNNWSIKKLRINIFLPPIVNQSIRPLHWLFYLFCNWQLFQKKYLQPIETEKFNHQYKLIKRWLFIFCAIFTFLTILLFFITISNMVYRDKNTFVEQTYYVLVTIGISYIALNISLLLFPHILYGLPIEIIKLSSNTIENGINTTRPTIVTNLATNEQVDIENDDKGKYTQLFSAAYIDDIANRLIAWEGEMKYTNPDCSLISLSLETKIPFHHLSYYFNTHLNYKFIDWRNKLRIENTCKDMQNGKCDSLTIESIALHSGFAAQSTFIRAFKIVTGVTPSDYLKQIEKEKVGSE